MRKEKSQRQISRWIGLGNGGVGNEGGETREGEGGSGSERSPFVEGKIRGLFFVVYEWNLLC